MMNKQRAAFGAAILLAWMPWLVPAAYSAVWQWSESASSNASSDPQINWREGQPPSSVNDSARSMMAALASYRDDISGLLTSTGTASAYSVTTNQNLCASPATVPQDGQQLAVTVNVTNGTAPTLTADACSTYPIQSAAGVAVGSATLIQGSPYTFRFSVANSAWMLRDFYGVSTALTVPLGAMIPYTGITAPNSNFVFPAGQCLSTTTYAAYWVFLGSPASGSCSGGQFQIIDMGGRVPAGLDTMPGFSASNRLTSASTGCGTAMTTVGAACANGSQSQTLTAGQIPSLSVSVGVSGSISGTAATNAFNAVPGGAAVALSPSGPAQPTAVSGTFSGSGSGSTTNTGGSAHPIVPPIVGVTYLLRVI